MAIKKCSIHLCVAYVTQRIAALTFSTYRRVQNNKNTLLLLKEQNNRHTFKIY